MAKSVFDSDSELLKYGLASVPVAVLKDTSINHLTARLYSMLCSYAWGKKETCNPGINTLSRDLGTSSATIKRGIKALRDAGYIEVLKGGDGATNTYRILTKNRELNFEPSEKAEGSNPSFRGIKAMSPKDNNESNKKQNKSPETPGSLNDSFLEDRNSIQGQSKSLVVRFKRAWESYPAHKRADARFTVLWSKYMAMMSRLIRNERQASTTAFEDLCELVDVYFKLEPTSWVAKQAKTLEHFTSNINLVKAEALKSKGGR